MADPQFDGVASLPILWDKLTKNIVNNQANEIVKMLNDEFNEFAKDKQYDIFPKAHGDEICKLGKQIYNHVH